MRIKYNSDDEVLLDALLQRDGTLTIHKKKFPTTNGRSIYLGRLTT